MDNAKARFPDNPLPSSDEIANKIMEHLGPSARSDKNLIIVVSGFLAKYPLQAYDNKWNGLNKYERINELATLLADISTLYEKMESPINGLVLYRIFESSGLFSDKRIPTEDIELVLENVIDIMENRFPGGFSQSAYVVATEVANFLRLPRLVTRL